MKTKNLKKIVLGALLSASVLGLSACSDKDTYIDASADPYSYSNSNGSVSIINEDANYTQLSYGEKTEILGTLENYGVNNWLSGLTLYGNGSYLMYNNRVTKGTNNYVSGYGFGILTEGSINSSLSASAQPNAAWRNYYHTFSSSDDGTHNYRDSSKSTANTLNGYLNASYWESFLNNTKTGYEYKDVLANGLPVAENPNNEGYSTTWKFEVSSTLKYSTLSQKDEFSKFNNTTVKADDYLTPFKMLHDSRNGLYRLKQGLAASGASQVKGLANFVTVTAKEGVTQSEVNTAWSDVGIKATTENGKIFLEFEFVNEIDQFFAQYNVMSNMYGPVPAEFVTALEDYENAKGNSSDNKGAKLIGTFTNSKLTPVDTHLSTGPYVAEEWKQGEHIALKKNPNYPLANKYYQIEGIHYDILTAATTDSEAGLKEFLAGNLDGVSIPLTKLNEYKNDPRTTISTESTTFKMNLNTLTQFEWEQNFGTNGSVSQTQQSGYWECDPAMSNENFLLGLYYAFDRNTYTSDRGYTPSCNFFSNTYMSNPVDRVIYNETDEHKEVLAARNVGTDAYGYSAALAEAAFEKAAQELLVSGAYKQGDTITLQIGWMYNSHESSLHNDLADMWASAFNKAANKYGLSLKFEFWAGATWDAVYDNMETGQFDIAFGSVSGSSMNPLDFLEVMRSDNSSAFTTNWGTSTSRVTDTISYKGFNWSFDDLWKAANVGYKAELTAGASLQSSSRNDLDGRDVKAFLTTNAGGGKFADDTATLSKVELAVGTSVVEVTSSNYNFTDNIFTYSIPSEYELKNQPMKLIFTFTSGETTFTTTLNVNY